MKKFKYGIMVLHTKTRTENGDYPVVHFAGYWKEPTQADFESLKEELRNDPYFELRDVVNELGFFPATQDCVDFYNKVCEEDGAFNLDKFGKEKLN